MFDGNVPLYVHHSQVKQWCDAQTVKTALPKPISTQYVPDVFPCSSSISQPIKRGWPITPITASVEDKQASAMLDLVLTWFLVFTAIMISTFKTAVIGHVDDADDCDEDKPAVNFRGCMINSSLRGQSTSMNCTLRLWGFAWIHIFFFALIKLSFSFVVHEYARLIMYCSLLFSILKNS